MTVKNGDGDEKQKPRVLIKPRVPAAAKPAPDDIQTRIEKSDRALPQTVRPPKPPPPQSAPVSIRTGSHEHITGEEKTEAAPVSVPAQEPRVKPATSRPPPPPVRPKTKLPEISVACDKIIKDASPSITPRNKADSLAKLYDEQFQTDPKDTLKKLFAAGHRHEEEIKLLIENFGNDQKKFMKGQEVAREKWDKRMPLEPVEDKIIELINTKKAIEGFNSNDQQKLETFDDYVKKKYEVAGRLNALEKYLYELLRLKQEATKHKNEADEYDRINSMRSSRRYSEKYDRDKSPKGVRSEKSPSIRMPAEPAFVENEEGNKIVEAKEEPERRTSRPPSTVYRKEPGFIRRLFSDPMFYTTIGLSAFTAALVKMDSFTEMARGLRHIWHNVLHRPDFEFTRLHTGLGYAAIMGAGLGITILLRRREVKKKFLRYQEMREGSRKEHERKDRVIAKLTKISLEHDKFEDQLTHLRQAMLQDPQFMEDLYELKKHKFFNEMLSEARVHPKLVTNLNIIFERVKVEKLQKRLNKLAELLTNPEQRCSLFKEYYDRDQIFQMMIDEIFERRGGNYVNIDKQNAAFHEVLNELDENVGQQLRKALGDDFESFRN